MRRFNWSSQNKHIGRADGAVRLIDELSRVAESSDSLFRAGASPRILVWAHSHGGNVLALASNLLGGDANSRREFFHAARSFYHSWRHARVDFPAWQRVEGLLAGDQKPLHRTALDFVTFGTPIRYGWETAGYAKLLHVINHRPTSDQGEWLAPYPPRVRRALTAADGDYVQQIGIAGSGCPVLPLTFRTFTADRRVRRLVANNSRWLLRHLRKGARVPDEGLSLLVDYADPARFPWTHLFGHAVYTRSRWLPMHCELTAREFYGAGSGVIDHAQ